MRKSILRQTEDDVEQIDKQIKEEQAAGIIASPEAAAGVAPQGEPAPAPAPAPASEGGEQPQITIGEIVPDEEQGYNA